MINNMTIKYILFHCRWRH